MVILNFKFPRMQICYIFFTSVALYSLLLSINRHLVLYLLIVPKYLLHRRKINISYIYNESIFIDVHLYVYEQYYLLDV